MVSLFAVCASGTAGTAVERETEGVAVGILAWFSSFSNDNDSVASVDENAGVATTRAVAGIGISTYEASRVGSHNREAIRVRPGWNGRAKGIIARLRRESRTAAVVGLVRVEAVGLSVCVGCAVLAVLGG